MTYRFRAPGRPATPDDLHRARQRDELFRTELPRVRAAALAWRNGLAALLTGLLGFGLIKGRSDVSGLAQPYAVAVGALLLAALVVGAAGACWLMTAGHGLPSITTTARLGSRISTDHEEAVRAVAYLRRGIAATLGCAAILVAAVGMTWYGPGADPALQVTTPTGTQCGSLLRLGPGGAVLTTKAGPIPYAPTETITIRPGGPACAGPS
ncbi:hypothetical protein [Streptomyces sp. NBC_01538]|uniref:hypothetical protein n=1 Tax=Streptomyces sp. NBC_01538 TaxID=2903897 RepID=UPI00386DF407